MKRWRHSFMLKSDLWRYVWSNRFLFSTPMLWLLFWINLGGTIYGYVWYWEQLVETYEEMSRWLLPFVPDSPTASLFFTFSLLFMIVDRSKRLGAFLERKPIHALRTLIDVLAVITLVKYGIWAVIMNFADGYQGGGIAAQQWMLIASHAGMAVQAVLYARLMKLNRIAIVLASIWTLANDYLDYHLDIHPWLYSPLEDDIATIEAFTIALSLMCISLSFILYKRSRSN